MSARIEKTIARFLAVLYAPEGGALVHLFRSHGNGWIRMPDELERARRNSGLGDAYVTIYESDAHILSCLFSAIFPEGSEHELTLFAAEYTAASEQEKLDFYTKLSAMVLSDDFCCK